MFIRLPLIAVCILCIQVSFSLSPKNSYRGSGIVWKNELKNQPGLLHQLHERGYRYLWYRAGYFDWDKKQGLIEQTQSFSLKESDWEGRFSFDHFLEFEIRDSLLLAIEAKTPLVIESLLEALSQELSYYGGKFQGVCLRSNLAHLPKGLDLSQLKAGLAKSGMKLGLSLPLSSLDHASTVFIRTPDFYIFHLGRELVFNYKALSKKVGQAASLNSAFFLSFSMAPEVRVQGGRRKIQDVELFIEKADLRLEHERILGFEQSQEFLLNQELTWNQIPYPKDAIVNVHEPTLKGMHRFLTLASRLEPYWYSGVVFNPGSWSTRVLLSDSLEIVHPKVYYQVHHQQDGIELSLELENPNPVASSIGKEDAGIALRLNGFKLSSMSLGGFDGLRASPTVRGQEIFITKGELGAYAKVGPFVLKLHESSPGSSIQMLGWIRPRTEDRNYYDSGEALTRIPAFQFAKKSKLIWDGRVGQEEVEGSLE
jgi:hypothetical protein